jgi:GNAT superfamily N-acetyltransferase
VTTLVRYAERADTGSALATLNEAVSWLAATGQPLWQNTLFTASYVEDAIARGSACVGTHEGSTIAFMLLEEADTLFWPEDKLGDALYLHKLCIRRSHAGGKLSSAMLSWAADEAVRRGKPALKLDCACRPKLMNLYEEFGFLRHDENTYTANGFTVYRYWLRTHPHSTH